MSATLPPPDSDSDEQLDLLPDVLFSPPPKKGKRKGKQPSTDLTNLDAVLSDPTTLHTERLDMRDALTATIKRCNGTQQAYIKITANIYRHGFGHQSARLFYESYGLPPNSRKLLPAGVLRVLLVYEFSIMRRLDRHVVTAEAQPDIDAELVEQSKLAAQATKRFLYWLDYGKTLPGGI